MKKKILQESLEDGKVRCNTCPRHCIIKEEDIGICKIRKNIRGTLNLLTYGKPVATSVDPVEKKPFFHFAPGTEVYSVATQGCNLRCKFCQNHSISYGWDEIKGINRLPEEVVEGAEDTGCKGIAYTYTEPTVFLEYCLDTIEESRDIYNVFVSNGYMSKETAEIAAEKIDAINIDLKGNSEFYRDLCGVPDNKPVYRTLEIMDEKDVFVEVTVLIVPGHNDDEEHIREKVKWIKENIGKDTPIHFSRFTPHHEMKHTPPTPVETLENAIEIAEDLGMDYVYCGNVPGHQNENTYCPDCGKVVIKRRGFRVMEKNLNSYGGCTNCGYEINLGGMEYVEK